ncbi:MAG: acyl--CoA ligase [Bradyrhizobiaceae bacterium]|nr:acyl--CoA ligase [Bradyrhizobiaceae bacterium]
MSAPPPNDDVAGGVSLDALFRANAVGRPELTALVDPPNKQRFADLPARRLTYDETDLAVEHLARRLRELGLPDGSVVAIQLPNIVETVVSLLAVARAGLTAVPVPTAWRRSDLLAALGRVEPKAMITLSQLDGERRAETACEVAAELFSLSFPCAFGTDLPDGVIGLELDCSVPEPSGQSANGHALRGSTILTFDAAADGFFPVARSDAQWLAAGLSVLLEARAESGDTIVSTLPPSSLAGIGGAVLPWLLSGGALELIHGAALPPIGAVDKSRRAHLIAPATALPELASDQSKPFSSCIGVHRRPQSLGLDFSPLRSERVVDLMSFGEIGMVSLRRSNASRAEDIPLGPITAPSATRGGPVVIETKIAEEELLLRGPQVPRVSSYDASHTPRVEFDADGFARTGFRCRKVGENDDGIALTASPERVVTVGGLRFGLDDLQSRFAQTSSGIKIAAVEDPLLGERLRIEAENPSAAAAALKAAGHSPLVVQAAAFGPVLQRAAG